MISRVIQYVRLRRKGFSMVRSAQVSNVLLPSASSITLFMAIALIFAALYDQERKAETRLKDATVLVKYHQAKIRATSSLADTKNLENVVIRCLRGDVVMINNHTHQCTLKKL